MTTPLAATDAPFTPQTPTVPAALGEPGENYIDVIVQPAAVDSNVAHAVRDYDISGITTHLRERRVFRHAFNKSTIMEQQT